VRKPVLVVTAYFVDAVEARLKQDFELRRTKNGAHFTPEDLLSAADGADAMLVTPADRLDTGFFTRLASSVKVIATHSAGYDHIDLSAAAARKIPIANVPALSTDAVADLTLLLLLGASRRAYEGLQVVRSGSWNPTDLTLLLGWQLTGKILGIYGMGHIGLAVAKRARGFGMKIHYHDPHRLFPKIERDAIFHENPYDLLRVSPFLSLNAPETKQTHHFFDAKAIACLPRGAIVVNAARGGIVVDEDLIAALKSGQVAAAGLDTYEGEPKLNPGYLSLKNIFLLPHIGAATIETRTAMGMLALDNIDAVLGGRSAPSLVT
jgi:lactate dehydrogenase-like 2-hydroxyacid dehydrogenase